MGGRPWTAAEDEAVRDASRHAATMFGFLKDCADDLGRSYAAVRQRAHRLGLTDPRIPAAPVEPVTRDCKRCGEPIGPRDPGDAWRRHYCGNECADLARGRCPGCGRKLTRADGTAQCPDRCCRRAGETWPG